MCTIITGLRSATLTPVVGVLQGVVEPLGVFGIFEVQ